MIDIVDRLRFDATRCEATFSKGVAGNITEGIAEIERLRTENGRLRFIVRVNLMRSCGATHAEIDAILDPVGSPPMQEDK